MNVGCECFFLLLNYFLSKLPHTQKNVVLFYFFNSTKGYMEKSKSPSHRNTQFSLPETNHGYQSYGCPVPNPLLTQHPEGPFRNVKQITLCLCPSDSRYHSTSWPRPQGPTWSGGACWPPDLIITTPPSRSPLAATLASLTSSNTLAHLGACCPCVCNTMTVSNLIRFVPTRLCSSITSSERPSQTALALTYSAFPVSPFLLNPA